MATVKYHISKAGNPAVCSAKIRCTLGDDVPHFASKEEALAHIEKEAQEKNSALSAVKRPAAKRPILDRVTALSGKQFGPNAKAWRQFGEVKTIRLETSSPAFKKTVDTIVFSNGRQTISYETSGECFSSSSFKNAKEVAKELQGHSIASVSAKYITPEGREVYQPLKKREITFTTAKTPTQPSKKVVLREENFSDGYYSSEDFWRIS